MVSIFCGMGDIFFSAKEGEFEHQSPPPMLGIVQCGVGAEHR